MGLPRTGRKYDAIWVAIDRLINTTHVLAIKAKTSLEFLIDFYIDEIMTLHRIFKEIVSDRDPNFTSRF